MTELTRRSLLAGTAVAGAALSLEGFTFARAAAPAATAQAPGFYRQQVGDYEVTALSDGARTFPMPDTFVVNKKKDEALAAADGAYMPKGQGTIPFNPVVVNTGRKLIVSDTGNGLGAFEQTKGAAGQMSANMKAAGIDPNAVDIVLISHFHADHIGGLRTLNGKLAYPNAEIMVPAPEWAFWTDEANVAKANGFNKGNFPTVKKVFDGLADKVTKFEWGKEVAPGNAKLLVQSDVTNIPALFLRNTDWHVVFDNDPELAQATRHKFYDMASAARTAVAGYHFSFPSLGYVEKDGAGYRLVPAAWNPAI